MAAALTEAQVWEVAFKALGASGAVLAALGAVIAFFLTRYWNLRDRAAAATQAARDKEREILYESLKWFEGGTQMRSIGIAVVSTSWQRYLSSETCGPRCSQTKRSIS